MSDAALLMDRNHLLMPVDRLSVAAAAGMSHSWNQQERSASQPLSPIAQFQSPFPPSPIMPATASSLSSPPPTPFYLLPTSPLPPPEGGALAAAELALLQMSTSRFGLQQLPQGRHRSVDSGRSADDDDDERSTSSLSVTTTAYSPVLSVQSTASASSSATSDSGLLPSNSQRQPLTAPSSLAPLTPSPEASPREARGQPDIHLARGDSAEANAALTGALDPAACYSNLVPSTLLSSSPSDGRSPQPPRRSSSQAVLWPSPAPMHLPPVTSLASLNFNCLDYSDDQLLVLTLHTFQHLNLVSTLNLSLPHLQTFLLSIRAHYRVNPYHNWYHGFHVFQFGFYMLTASRLSTLLTPLDQLALLVSCLCHDVDHPGTTNDFQIAIDSGLARIHNEIAVLENHHAFMTCEILRHPQSNFFTHFTAQQFRAFRRVVVAAILATDMAVHFELCRQFRRLDTDLAEYKSAKEEDRQLVLNLVVHSSDLSAQVMDFSIAELWEARVTAEFIAQNEMETALGVTVTPLMMGLQDQQKRYEKHLGFLQFVMQPLWDVVGDVLPPMQQCVDSLNGNRERYKQRLKQLVSEREEERQPINPAAASSSAPSSVASSTPASAVVSVTVTPSLSSAPTPVTMSPRHDGDDDSEPYQPLVEEHEAAEPNGKDER